MKITDEMIERGAAAMYEHDQREERRKSGELGLPFHRPLPIMPWDAQAGPRMDATRDEYRRRLAAALEAMFNA